MADGTLARSGLDDAGDVEFGDDVRVDIHPGGVPAVVRPRNPALAQDMDAFVRWFQANKDAFDRFAAIHGAILFRGFPTRGTSEFGRAIDHYPTGGLTYLGGGALRETIAGRVMESTRSPKSWPLQVHQEMSYLPRSPRMVAFFCNVAPIAGGETTLADFRLLRERLQRRFWDEVEDRGICYRRNFRKPGEIDPVRAGMHKTWAAAFETEDPVEAEAVCRRTGLEPAWEDDGSLSVSSIGPGVIEHAITGDTVWFNSMAGFNQHPQNLGPERWAAYLRYFARDGQPKPYAVSYADGGPIAAEDIEDLQLTFEAITVSIRWRQGDILLIDNVTTGHGRNPYEGARDIQVALMG